MPVTCSLSRLLLVLLMAMGVWAANARAQCALAAVAGGGLPDADGPVLASCVWDPDGGGPQSPVVVLGGAFERIGNAFASGLALFEPQSGDCSHFGDVVAAGATFAVAAVMVTASNDLVVGGTFTSVGGVAAANVARWDGSAWQPIGGGLPFSVRALTALPNGDIVAGGIASIAGPSPIQRWDGTAWSSMGTGLANPVLALATMPNGDVVAGGSVVLPGGVHLARWDGLGWSAFGGNVDGGVLALRVLANGDLIAAGGFLHAGGQPASGIARWNGTSWSSLGSGIPNPVYALTELANGDVVAGGLFQSAGGVAAKRVARWDGSAWHGLGSGLGAATGPYANTLVNTLVQASTGDLLAGGSFGTAAGDNDHIARWDGAAWRQLRAGTGGRVHTSATMPNGDLVLGGAFTVVEGIAANRVARRVNGIWQPLAGGADDEVLALLPLPGGELVIGGAFSSVDGVAANHIARWDGAAWHAIGAGLPGAVSSLALGPAGEILASGAFPDYVAFWDGQSWNGTGIIGIPFWPWNPRRLLTLPDGEVLAITVALGPGFVGRWTGFGWQAITTSSLLRGPLAVLPSGDIVASAGTSVKRWDGTVWANLGGIFDGYVDAMVVLPNGDLIVGGTFTANAGIATPGLARWNGSTWSDVGVAVAGQVSDVRWLSQGRVVVTGDFTSLGTVATAGFAELTSSCPSSAVVIGAGCSGTGGLNALSSTSLPWAGASFTSLASGLPANCIAVEVLGLGSSVQSLASLLPQGVVGCQLLTSPDVLDLAVPSAGELALQVAIPDQLSLLGVSFRQQVVALELGSSGTIVAATSTNALELTIGRF